MRPFTVRMSVGLVAAFVVAITLALANGLDIATAYGNSLVISLYVGATFAFVTLGSAISERKGYSPWFGFLAVLVLSVFGLLLLLLLPSNGSIGKPATIKDRLSGG